MKAPYLGAAILGLAFFLSSSRLEAADNLALSGTAILGLKESLESPPETELPFANSGLPPNINDGDLSTRVDTYNGGGPQRVSYVGITWDAPITTPISKIELTLALFGNGGWFGANEIGPAAGGVLQDEHLVEPRVEITTDNFVWTPVASSSDYYLALRGQAIGPPNSATAHFTLNQPATNITGIRLAGTEGGTVSGGFLGVFELALYGPGADSDSDGLDDEWEAQFGLNVGSNDASDDSDGDGLTNLQEFSLKIDSQKADTDGDTLADGAEVSVHHTNPQRVDTDGDGLNDNDEIGTLGTSPLSKDTDSDGFPDALELSSGADPTNASNYPANIAILGSGIIGVKDSLESEPDTEQHYANSGSAANVNDGNLNSRVDTYGPGATVSFVGVVWPEPISKPISALDLTLALFSNGGWFGVNGVDPGGGGKLTGDHLTEPRVEVTTDGASWTAIGHASDYLGIMTGQGIGGGGNPNPNPVTVTFALNQPATNITGIRIIGTDGGSAGGGFLGVFELATRTTPADSDNDGMDDGWERINGLIVGTNDSAGDSDTDGLTNVEEFREKTDPKVADSDGDGLNDGLEVKTHLTHPLRSDTDADGLSDGQEVTGAGTDPLKKDTDGDGFSDAFEGTEGTDPKNASSIPSNVAALGTGILGKKDSFDSGVEGEVPHFNSGSAGSINDGNLSSRVDTYGRGDQLSFVGILWDQPLTDPVEKLQLTHALFSNGGWFGAPGEDPGPGGLLEANDVEEPRVEITTDGGASWIEVAKSSDYLEKLIGAGIGGGAFPNPNPIEATFTIAEPAVNINGIRLVGPNGGTAGGGFLGVFELAVEVTRSTAPGGLQLLNAAIAEGQFRFEFESRSGVTHSVEFKNSLGDPTWQNHGTIQGDGSRKQVTAPLEGGQRIFRVSN